ncbi:hypothetical protein ACFVAE_10615 [Microbacterium sp. NPDC057659]|uniref:hypothetical protein n=1 Tax=Microbacterium sp. NPDC057659 TaxID=3346198 RepID=UPI00366A6CA9
MDPHAEQDAAGRDGDRRGRALRWPMLCWVTILLLIGVVQIVRAQWFDTAVFLTAAVSVAASAALPRHVPAAAPLRPLLATAVLLGAFLCLMPRHSPGMAAVVLLTGAGAVVVAWSGAFAGPHRWTPGLRRLGTVWAAALIAGCVWELVQFILGEIAPDRPTYALSDLIDPLLDSAAGRSAFIAAWLACGVFLLRRGRRR